MNWLYALLSMYSLEIAEVTAYTHTGRTTATCEAGVCEWPVAGYTVACDRPDGSTVLIPLTGQHLVCHDRHDNRTDYDIFMDDRASALRWGRKTTLVLRKHH